MKNLLLVLAFAAALLPELSDAAPPSRVPPPGKTISEEARAELTRSAAQLDDEIAKLRETLVTQPELLRRLPDIEIFHKAVAWPLRYNEFYRSNDVATARRLLQQGMERARQLRDGNVPWLGATGLVVRGYVSRIDGSIQPYGLVVPAGLKSDPGKPRRLDVWLHGRDNELTELKFISDRQRSTGEFAPPDTIVLHPYGRYCNAFKFAGETDVFEAMEQVKTDYMIDSARMAIRGFSMGGAGVWHLAAHHPNVWAVAAPGAGFAETAEYTGALTKQGRPPAWEQALWGLYDATDYGRNFFNLPVVAYNGTDDKQRQAADVMERAMQAADIPLPRVWGTNVGHKYTPESKREISAFVDGTVSRGKERLPEKVKFSTRTLRYNRAPGIEVLALDKHWAEASIVMDRAARDIRCSNISAFAIDEPGEGLFQINGEKVRFPTLPRVYLERNRKGEWLAKKKPGLSEFTKSPGLQGPIDDAFMESFVMVRPSGKAWHGRTATWTADALGKAMNDWRAQFRGDAPCIDDKDVTDAMIANHNLILWGDPASNRLLAKMVRKLPFRWSARSIYLGPNSVSSENHMVVLIYPNPLNPKRYVVLNSGFTFTAAGSGSNAQQTPKLPDYAIINLDSDEPIGAGFFNEHWEAPRD